LVDGQTATRTSTEGSGRPPGAPAWDWNRLLTPRIVLMMLPVAGMLLVAYAYPLMRWEALWRHQAAWSHGYLIPLLAVVVAHFRLKERPPAHLTPCIWGLALILAGCVLRIWARVMMFGYPGQATFLVVTAGVVLLVLGWPMLRTVWVAVLYLGLMIPWDVKYYEQIALPLQTLAAAAGERILSLLGFLVARSGNVLELPSGKITVAEACSGLHLLFAFVALGVLMAFINRRPLWERIIIMASSIPIAVLCNVIRVTLMAVVSDSLYFQRQAVLAGEGTWVPGFLLGLFEGDTAVAQLEAFRQAVLNPQSWLHQSFGFAMLGLAFVLMWLELRFIDLFFLEDEGGQAGGTGPGTAAAGASDSAAGGDGGPPPPTS
jgi:exosortase